jgi:acyl-CoA synthetase (AMP-forming)/AMP-acid ligase II
LSIAGRAKDMICVAGLSVFPAEVESFLLTHPDVVQAAIVGVPHATMGEVLQAFIVARPGSNLTPTMLLHFARARIAGYKLPYAIRMVSELPMLAAGKPDRVALAQMIQEETYADPHASKHPAL